MLQRAWYVASGGGIGCVCDENDDEWKKKSRVMNVKWGRIWAKVNTDCRKYSREKLGGEVRGTNKGFGGWVRWKDDGEDGGREGKWNLERWKGKNGVRKKPTEDTTSGKQTKMKILFTNRNENARREKIEEPGTGKRDTAKKGRGHREKTGERTAKGDQIKL